jgi:hypothetical protein
VQRELEALRRARTPEHVEGCLAALHTVGAPAAEVRAAIVAAYERLSDADRRRDIGCHTRTALLRELRDRATVDDVPLLVGATDTYEYSGPAEVACMLRAAALVALNELDPALAAYHAGAHLDDVDPMSSEPALTAARILGAHGQLVPLYAHSLSQTGGDALSECLRQLTGAPVSIQDRVIERHRESTDQGVQAALVDLLLDHPERERAERELLALLAAAPVAVFRYGATVLVSRRRIELVERLGELPATIRDRQRSAIFAEASSLLP